MSFLVGTRARTVRQRGYLIGLRAVCCAALVQAPDGSLRPHAGLRVRRPEASAFLQTTSTCPKERVDIVADPPLEEGLFGMVFERVLQLLSAAAATPERELHFAPHSLCYGNALASLFVDRLDGHNSSSCQGLQESQLTFEEAFRRGWAMRESDMHSFKTANALWTGRFAFAANVQSELEEAVAKFPTDGLVLGVHFRGTDKFLEARPVAANDMWAIVEDFVSSASDDLAGLFVTTDDDEFARMAAVRTGNLTGRGGHPLQLLVSPSARSHSDLPLHKQGSCAPILARQALMDTLVLSRCDIVLKTASQLSAWSKIFNPSLQIFRVNAFYQSWFLDAALPLYAPNGAPAAITTLLMRLQDGNGSPVLAKKPFDVI